MKKNKIFKIIYPIYKNNLQIDKIVNIDIILSHYDNNYFKILKINNFTKNNTYDEVNLLEDYTDIITGFLEDPVRYKSNGIIIDTPVNRSTTKKFKNCPFTSQ